MLLIRLDDNSKACCHDALEQPEGPYGKLTCVILQKLKGVITAVTPFVTVTEDIFLLWLDTPNRNVQLSPPASLSESWMSIYTFSICVKSFGANFYRFSVYELMSDTILTYVKCSNEILLTCYGDLRLPPCQPH